MWAFSRKGPSGFSSRSTAEEVTEGIDGTGLTAIVTGASNGIGTETARVLALRGVHVVMGVRNMASGKEAKEAIVKEIPTAKIEAMELDLSSLASVRKFASEFNSLGLPLNLLMNHGNSIHAFQRQDRATVCNKPLRILFLLLKLEIQGHFLLTDLLLETMKKTAHRTSKEGRIVNVSSRRHQFTYPEGIRFDKMNDQSGYSSLSAYGQSKLANVLHANQLARDLKDNGVEITANSLHPGVIATNLFRHHRLVSGLVDVLGKYVIKNVQQGAATTCYVALHPQVKGMSGKYFADCKLAEASSQANDTDLAKKLWDFSLSLINQCAHAS
ncbi:hypothetical protein RHSIM_Rhsim09G0199400 [Rhododendron simsii]|uniref:Short-chain dehydrogenase TIC 32, chloroplastic-like n=1 Tax=Rhododendron simsii TaxID=118357 RepID=A0A834GEY6_RHOSS|nr:hypothetical protein RHSIM_Rhsim09G0199400 [Rhododendron simsii]